MQFNNVSELEVTNILHLLSTCYAPGTFLSNSYNLITYVVTEPL